MKIEKLHQFRDQAIQCIQTVFFFTYLPAMYAIVSSFNCLPPDWQLEEDRERMCFSGDYITFLAKTGVVFIILGLAAPTSLLVQFLKHRKNIQCLINCNWSKKDLSDGEFAMIQKT